MLVLTKNSFIEAVNDLKPLGIVLDFHGENKGPRLISESNYITYFEKNELDGSADEISNDYFKYNLL